MEMNDLRIFAEVARLESMSKAAEKLGYVQSNITSRIRGLEIQLGTPLFLRHPKGVQLLPEGRILLQYADQITALADQAQKEISISREQMKLGATQTITSGYMRELMWNERLPMAVYTRPIRELASMLKSRELDVILVNRELPDEQLECGFMLEDRIAWMAACNLTGQPDSQLPIIVVRDPECPYQQSALKYVKDNNACRKILEADTLDIVLSTVENGQAVALLPSTLASEKLKRLDLPLFEPPALHIYMYFCKVSHDHTLSCKLTTLSGMLAEKAAV
ncbi:LysR family transcriptional regulator [Paenibacillus sp. Z6-24]